MRLRRTCGLALVVFGLACGGGGGPAPDAAVDARAPDKWAAESSDGGEAADLVRGSADTAAPLDTGDSAGDRAGVLDAASSEPRFEAPLDAVVDAPATDDGGSRHPCEPSTIVVLPLVGAGTVTVTGTLNGASHLLPQTPRCTAGLTGPEVIYALDVPAGEFHLVAATVTTADTILYVQTACGAGVELACNDDDGLPGPSRVATAVTGPQRVYLVVDSLFPEPQARAFSLTVSLAAPPSAGVPCKPVDPGALDPCAAGLLCAPAAGASAVCTAGTAPAIAAAELFLPPGQTGGQAMLYLSAHDAQADWKALRLDFRNAAGAWLATYELNLSDFWGLALLTELPLPLALPAGASSAEVLAVDSLSLTTAAISIPIIPWGNLGQACDETLVAPDPCLGDLVCDGGVCAASTATSAACAEVGELELGVALSGTAAGLATDRFEGTCRVERGGNDRVFRVELPPLPGSTVAWDLLASTASPGAPYDYLAHLDTYLYVRRDCTMPASELACDDDITETEIRSEVVATSLPPGRYFVYLDTSSPTQNGSLVTYTLLVRARAVLPPGAACDPQGDVDRCQNGRCPEVTPVCP